MYGTVTFVRYFGSAEVETSEFGLGHIRNSATIHVSTHTFWECLAESLLVGTASGKEELPTAAPAGAKVNPYTSFQGTLATTAHSVDYGYGIERHLA